MEFSPEIIYPTNFFINLKDKLDAYFTSSYSE